MSWFNASQLSSFAKQALSQAQKSIDRVLDIQEEEPSAWAEAIPYGEPGKRVPGSRCLLAVRPQPRGPPASAPVRVPLTSGVSSQSAPGPRSFLQGPERSLRSPNCGASSAVCVLGPNYVNSRSQGAPRVALNEHFMLGSADFTKRFLLFRTTRVRAGSTRVLQKELNETLNA